VSTPGHFKGYPREEGVGNVSQELGDAYDSKKGRKRDTLKERIERR